MGLMPFNLDTVAYCLLERVQDHKSGSRSLHFGLNKRRRLESQLMHTCTLIDP
jgi:hypothetical protein